MWGLSAQLPVNAIKVESGIGCANAMILAALAESIKESCGRS